MEPSTTYQLLHFLSNEGRRYIPARRFDASKELSEKTGIPLTTLHSVLRRARASEYVELVKPMSRSNLTDAFILTEAGVKKLRELTRKNMQSDHAPADLSALTGLSIPDVLELLQTLFADLLEQRDCAVHRAESAETLLAEVRQASEAMGIAFTTLRGAVMVAKS